MIKRLLSFVLLVSLTFAVFAQPAGYYDNATGKTGAELKTALYNIVKGHTAISYDGLWTAFQTTDKKANGKVWDMYSNVEFTFGSNQCGSYSSEGDCYNREHSFPKSWFNDATPMYSDLFHLYPTDGYVNNRRGNLPFGEVSAPTYTSGNGSKVGPCSYVGYSGTVFEPTDEYKGDFARSYFYMATRYENVISTWPGCDMLDGSAYPVFTIWAKNMLLEWSQQDPVSQKEIDRNNAVYSIQHNRNPFIDHPEYADAIWGNGTVALNFTSNAVTSATVNQAYSYAITVTGPTGSTFTITAPTKPDWLTLTSTGSKTATLSGTPTSTGSFDVVLSVTDGTSTKTQSFTIVVAALEGLKFTSTPTTSATVGAVYTYSITTSDAAHTSATITLTAAPKPTWLTLTDNNNGTATLSGTPSAGDAGANAVTLSATDGFTTVAQNFNITVTDPNVTKTETFTNIGSASTSYLTRSWTGDDGSTWTATQARTDQVITTANKAICLKDAAGTYVQSGTLAGGCGSVSFKTLQVFTGTGGTLTLFINGTQIGSAFAYSTTEQTATFSNINVTGSFVIKIVNNGSARPVIDDVSWTSYTAAPNVLPSITNILNNPSNPLTNEAINVSATVTDSDGTIQEAYIMWGTTAGSLTNKVSMTLNGGSYMGTIPAQVSAGIINYSVSAKDNSGDITTSDVYSVIITVPNIPPSVSDIAINPSSPITGQDITISATIIDSDGVIEDAWLRWGTSSSALTNQLAMSSTVNNKYQAIIPAQLQSGTIYVAIYSRDDSGDETSSTYNFAITGTNVLPSIADIAINPSSPITGQAIVVSANITDADGSIQLAYVNWGVNESDLSNTVDMTLSGGKYNATIPAQSSATTIYLSVNAKDDLDATSQSLYNFTILQNQLPTISNFAINPTNPTTGQAITVSVNLADADGTIQEAWIDWGVSANSLTNNVSLSLSAGVYSCSIPAQSSAGTIYLAVTVKDNILASSTATFNFNVTPATGIEENLKSTVKVYPNPAKNSINVEINEQKASTITISNIIGGTMIKVPYNGGKQPVDISMLKSGVYFVTVSGNDFRNTIRIVKY